jgi:hypothetical protein
LAPAIRVHVAHDELHVPTGSVNNAPVSEKAPQNYMIHTIVIAIILATIMVLFLRHQWG